MNIVPDQEEEVANDEHQGNNNSLKALDENEAKRIALTIHNLTDDGKWLIAAWTEWSYKQLGIRSRGDRHRTHKVEIDEGAAGDSKEKKEGHHRGHKFRKHGHTGSAEGEHGKLPASHRIIVDEGENRVQLPSDEPVPSGNSSLL
ncbi:unnamed protein product [Gongylonema pulchrum]|uniref:DUSP domain-containing protein n=1 Tax=Gongylonema pulchrum TaxID=637853 RepID=A0A183F023_9BILA|nr:unnamed protein product [Gongylonema pulchrum]